MGERPYVCSNGHALANRVLTCPMCGAPGKPVRPSAWSLFAVALVVLAIAGVAITVIGRDGTSSSAEEAAATTEPPPSTVVLDATATTEAPTTTTEATTTTTSTTVATTTTTTTAVPPTTATTAAPPVTAPPTSIVRTPPPTVPAPPPTVPVLDARAQQAIAQQAVVVAYTTGHQPAGYPSAAQVIAPELRGRLDAVTVGAGYRQAGCRQRVEEVRPGAVASGSYGFSFTLVRTCDRVPRANGYVLPLETGAYATVVLGPTWGGVWAVDLLPG